MGSDCPCNREDGAVVERVFSTLVDSVPGKALMLIADVFKEGCCLDVAREDGNELFYEFQVGITEEGLLECETLAAAEAAMQFDRDFPEEYLDERVGNATCASGAECMGDEVHAASSDDGADERV